LDYPTYIILYYTLYYTVLHYIIYYITYIILYYKLYYTVLYYIIYYITSYYIIFLHIGKMDIISGIFWRQRKYSAREIRSQLADVQIVISHIWHILSYQSLFLDNRKVFYTKTC